MRFHNIDSILLRWEEYNRQRQHGSGDRVLRGSDVLFNHYRDLVTRQDADRFWHILPPEAKIIGMPDIG